MGKTRNQGVDLSLEYNHVFNPDFLLTFKGTFTYAKNTLIFRDEPDYEWDYQYERGGPMNRIGRPTSRWGFSRTRTTSTAAPTSRP